MLEAGVEKRRDLIFNGNDVSVCKMKPSGDGRWWCLHNDTDGLNTLTWALKNGADGKSEVMLTFTPHRIWGEKVMFYCKKRETQVVAPWFA